MSPNIARAAAWLVNEHDRDQQPKVIPAICRTFGLTAVQAIEAIREANRLRAASLQENPHAE